MKKYLIALALLFASVFPANAQDKQFPIVYAGATGGYSFSNSFVGPVVGFDIPIKRIEFSGEESFNPITYHTALGSGHSESTSFRSDVWVTKNWSVNGQYDVTSYHTLAVKSSKYVFGGLAWQGVAAGQVTQFTFSYFQQINNGISANGTETDHVKGGSFEFVTRLGCSGLFCYRFSGQFTAGHVLTQSNPICDGTFGVTGGPNGGPCYRTGAVSGGASLGFAVEFPHRESKQP